MRLSDRLNSKTFIAGLVLLAALAIAVPAGYFRLAARLGETSVPPFLPLPRNFLSFSLTAVSLLAVGHLSLHRKTLRGNSRKLLPIVALLAGAVFLTYIVLPPTGSADVYWYAASARAWVDRGVNPYAASPVGLTEGRLLDLMDRHANHPSPYGPIHNIIGTLPVRLTGQLDGQIILYKLIGVVCFMLAGWLLYRFLRRDRRDWAPDFLAYWLFCPWAAYETALNGHNDAWLVLPLAVFLIAVSRRRTVAAVVAITVAALIKPWVLALLPLLAALRGSGWKRWSAAALSSLVVIGIACLPFIGDWSPFSGMAFVSRLTAPYYMGPVMFMLLAVAKRGVADPSAAATTAKLVSLGLAALGSALTAILLWLKRLSPQQATVIQFTLFFLLSFWIQGWYLLGVMPFMAWFRGQRLPQAFAWIGLIGCLHYLITWTQAACLFGTAWLFWHFGLKPALKLIRE